MSFPKVTLTESGRVVVSFRIFGFLMNTNDRAIFSELGSSPSSMEAAKVIDVFGSQPGYSKQQADAKQAYTQALFKGVETGSDSRATGGPRNGRVTQIGLSGEHDRKSTSGCALYLVGPNTYYPLNAFSKKQTSVTMSSTESEVISANHGVRAQA